MSTLKPHNRCEQDSTSPNRPNDHIDLVREIRQRLFAVIVYEYCSLSFYVGIDLCCSIYLTDHLDDPHLRFAKAIYPFDLWQRL